MTIKRDDVGRRIVDFSDVASGRRLPPVHPGKILRDELLTPHANTASTSSPMRSTCLALGSMTLSSDGAE